MVLSELLVAAVTDDYINGAPGMQQHLEKIARLLETAGESPLRLGLFNNDVVGICECQSDPFYNLVCDTYYWMRCAPYETREALDQFWENLYHGIIDNCECGLLDYANCYDSAPLITLQ